MNSLLRLSLLAVVIYQSEATAEVIDAGAGGFTTINHTHIAAPRDVVWRAAVDDIGKWWSGDHTISGDASRLSIAAKPQGCFCEHLGESAGVVHLTVTMVNPNVVLRMTGGLGPLGLMGVGGNMTWEFEDTGEGSTVTFTYAVGGYRAAGLDSIADPVDAVIGDALMRLKSQVETGRPESAEVE